MQKKARTKEENCILGIDTSTTSTGWSIVSLSGKVIDFGKIAPKEELTYLEKCQYISGELIKITQAHRSCIRYIAMEQPNSFRGGEITRMLCGLFGIVRYVLYTETGIVAHEINTKHNKSVVSGNGSADKEEMIKAINNITNLKLQYNKKKELSDDDIADAIGICITFIKDRNNG